MSLNGVIENKWHRYFIRVIRYSAMLLFTFVIKSDILFMTVRVKIRGESQTEKPLLPAIVSLRDSIDATLYRVFNVQKW